VVQEWIVLACLAFALGYLAWLARRRYRKELARRAACDHCLLNPALRSTPTRPGDSSNGR
jgi:hypothetical protein